MGDSFEFHLLLLIFYFALSLRLYFYFRYFMPFAFLKETNSSAVPISGVSIIIAARNEESNLLSFVPMVMRQDYPLFELIVVDDHSTDNSWTNLMELNKKFDLLRVFQLGKLQKGKKAALQFAISKAQYSNLLFIDADCYPGSQNWIKGILEKAASNEIVLGYGRYEKRAGFLNKLIRYDTLHTGMRYLSFAKAGKPYMGVGRNLFYTKKTYENSTAFKKYADIPYGDDDLLVNEMAGPHNTGIATAVKCHTVSLPNENISDFFLQKLRHLGTGKYYKTADKLRLGMESLSKALLIASATALLIYQQWIVLPFILVMVILQWMVLANATDKLMDKDLVICSPVLELFHFIFLFICGTFSLFNRKTTWK